MNDSITVIIGIICTLFIAKTIYNARQTQLYNFPGPAISRWTGALLTYHWIFGNRAPYVHDLHKKYVSPTEVDVCDISAAREVHRIRNGFLKSPWYKRLTLKDVENSFNTGDPEFHKFHRRLLARPLSESALQRVEAVVHARVRQTVRRIGDEMRCGVGADMFKWWTFMTTDVIGELSFGEPFRLVERGQDSQFSRDLETVISMQGIRAAFPGLVGTDSLVSLPLTRRAVQASRRMLQHASDAVEGCRVRSTERPEEAQHMLFKDMLREDEKGLSQQEIRDEALIFIVAGSGTTAATLTYLVWAVCRDSSVKAALVEAVSGLPNSFGNRDVQELQYVEWVINETLRLYASSPSGLPRIVPPGGTELAGYWFPGGSTVTTQAYSLHRDATVFPDPERFDPLRWEAPTEAMINAFMPFGGGSRICLGMHLARMELRLATAQFFRTLPNAVVSMKTSDTDMEQRIYFTMSPKAGSCFVQCL